NVARAVETTLLEGIQQRSDWNARLAALLTICESARVSFDLNVPTSIVERANRLQSMADRFSPGQDASDLDAVIADAIS
ncbi:MAG: hypothetical protein ACOVP2_09840, partial [Armatimonadaceae bacterium]